MGGGVAGSERWGLVVRSSRGRRSRGVASGLHCRSVPARPTRRSPPGPASASVAPHLRRHGAARGPSGRAGRRGTGGRSPRSGGRSCRGCATTACDDRPGQLGRPGIALRLGQVALEDRARRALPEVGLEQRRERQPPPGPPRPNEVGAAVMRARARRTGALRLPTPSTRSRSTSASLPRPEQASSTRGPTASTRPGRLERRAEAPAPGTGDRAATSADAGDADVDPAIADARDDGAAESERRQARPAATDAQDARDLEGGEADHLGDDAASRRSASGRSRGGLHLGLRRRRPGRPASAARPGRRCPVRVGLESLGDQLRDAGPGRRRRDLDGVARSSAASPGRG